MDAQHEDGWERESGSSRRRWWVIAAVVVLVAVWYSGTFDRALVNVGLNSRPCGTNGFGATFCGDDRERYERDVAQPARDAQDDLRHELMREEALRRQQQRWDEEDAAYCAEFPDDPTCY